MPTETPRATDVIVPAETVTALIKQYRSLVHQNQVDRGHHAAALAAMRNTLLQLGILTDEEIHAIYTDIGINPPSPEPKTTWQIIISINLDLHGQVIPRHLIQADSEALAEQIRSHWNAYLNPDNQDKLEIYEVPIVRTFEQYLEDFRKGVGSHAELQTAEETESVGA